MKANPTKPKRYAYSGAVQSFKEFNIFNVKIFISFNHEYNKIAQKLLSKYSKCVNATD